MTCDRIRDLLQEYHLDRLHAGREEVERHLADCAECREDLEALRFVAARTADLPRAIVPERELWHGIERRIRPARRAWLVAASLLLLLLPTALLLRGGNQGEPLSPGPEIAALVQSYRTAAHELGSRIADGREGDPARPSVARQLRTLDAAISETEQAFREDPADPAVQALLLSAHRKKLHLLRQAAALAGGD